MEWEIPLQYRDFTADSESGGIGYNGTQHVLRFPCWGTLKEVKQAREKENPHPLRYTRDSARREPRTILAEYLKAIPSLTYRPEIYT